MGKRRRDEKTVHVSYDGDVVKIASGHKTMSISWYIRKAKAAMEDRAYYDAWLDFGSALARSTDSEEIWDLKQLEKEALKRIHPPKGHKKKDADKRGKRREYA